MRKWLSLALALVLVCLLPVEVSARDTGSLEIKFRYGSEDGQGGMALVGATFHAYRVAEMTENGIFTKITPDFEDFVTMEELNEMDQDGWKALATRLKGDVENSPEAEASLTGKTDGTGTAHISVPLGLYLVYSEPHTQDHATFVHLPVLVTVPYYKEESDRWIFDNVPLFGKPMEAKNKLKVIKFWDDNNNAAHQRPDTLDIQLLRNGQLYDTVRLPHNGKWEYIWEELEYGPDWTVRERGDGGGYHWGAPVRDDKGTEYIIWTITNKYAPTPPAYLPQTGQLWWPVPVMLAAGLLCILVGMVRRGGGSHEE